MLKNQKSNFLTQAEGQLGEHHAGELRQANAEAKGERILVEELQGSA
jgi:hypothetical protein